MCVYFKLVGLIHLQNIYGNSAFLSIFNCEKYKEEKYVFFVLIEGHRITGLGHKNLKAFNM